MAAQGGRPPATLSEVLHDETYRFDFFQAVRLLQALDRDRQPVGGDSDPARESVRFRSDVSMSFPASDVRSLERSAEGEGPDRLTVNFFGVATPASWGSLPTCYAELVRERIRDRDPALRDFLDLFNHRLLSLFYRAWEKHRFEVEWERSDPGDGGLFERALLATLGMRTEGLRDRMPFPDLALLRWAGVLLRRPTTAHGLRELLQGYFDVPVAVEQFVSGWYRLDDEERLRLGGSTQELGRDTFAGSSVRIAQFKFRLRLGPLDRATYRSQLPGGAGFRALKEMVRFAAGPEFDFEIQLVLRGDEVPRLRLGGDPSDAARLGWDTWLASGPLDRDPDDVIVSSGAHAPETGAVPPHRH